MDQYKSARAEADHVAALLRAALVRAGVPEGEAARVRGLVTGSGRAYIELGALRMGSAVKLCEALPLARAGTTATLPAESFG
jgi:hypothetical protein